MTGRVQVERDGTVAIIVLDRPEARTAIDAALAGATVDAIESCQDAGAIVLTGADPAFCAGLDLRDLGVERGGFTAASSSRIAAQREAVINRARQQR